MKKKKKNPLGSKGKAKRMAEKQVASSNSFGAADDVWSLLEGLH